MKINGLMTLILTAIITFPAATVAQTNSVTSPKSPSQISNKERNKLKQLEEEKQSKELVEKTLKESPIMRDRVTMEVDRAFNHTTSLLNMLLFLLVLLPIVSVGLFWLLRRSIINQISSEIQEDLQSTRHQLLGDVAQQINAELDKDIDVFRQEIQQITSSAIWQLQEVITETQNSLEDLEVEKGLYAQKIANLKHPTINQPETYQHQISSELVLESSQHIDDDDIESPVFNTNYYLNQGDDFFAEGLYEQANNAYNQVLKIDRDFTEARYKNARCYGLRRNINLAIGNLQWAIDLNPEYKEIAKTDPAFDSIRSDDQFKNLING